MSLKLASLLAKLFSTTQNEDLPHPGTKMRHSFKREPPISVYIGLNIRQQARSKKLIQQLYQMGIIICYDRVTELEDWIATSTCEQFIQDGAVAPACLRKGLFTIGDLDNIDNDPSSTTTQTSFHGTGSVCFSFVWKYSQHSLPDSYVCLCFSCSPDNH